eukprot:Nitzschia sp. Nitz4//scaffold74_size92883//31247//31804//NITZ4_004820-RA/size92883-processed-gene-0.31-mRNA-1//-1//CDS//3329557586//6644//frame0
MNWMQNVPYLAYIVLILTLTYFLFQKHHNPRPWKRGKSEFDKEFSKLVQTDRFWGGSIEFQTILSKLLTAFNEDECQGVIISCDNSKFQMLEFDKQKGPILHKGLPMIPVLRWGNCTNRKTAMTFLSPSSSEKDTKVKIETIVCETEDMFRAVFEHLATTCRQDKVPDPNTKRKVYRGFLSPQKV